MTTFKNFALVEYGAPGRLFQVPDISDMKEYRLRKILLKGDISVDSVRLQYPQAEIVTDKESILHDNSIDLVIVSSPGEEDMGLVGEVLQAGKHVRVV